YTVLFLLLAFIIALVVFQFLTEYIWMDTLGFAQVFTTILKSKISLVVAGFVLFALTTYVTLFWIRRSYLSHFDAIQLPKIMLDRKKMTWIFIGISVVIGLFGSSIVQSLGWERTLKFLNHAEFGQTDPFFDLDISFYMFVLPFLKWIIYVLLGLCIFFFLVFITVYSVFYLLWFILFFIFVLPFLKWIIYVLMGLSIFFLLVYIAAYSVFHMWRINRSAQLHMGVTLAVIGLLLAGLHLLAPYETLLTNRVSLFQK